jgi:hypothetical protein
MIDHDVTFARAHGARCTRWLDEDDECADEVSRSTSARRRMNSSTEHGSRSGPADS